MRRVVVLRQYGDMARLKTTLTIDDRLMRAIRIRAARTGQSPSDVLEEALREGLGVVDRIRAKAGLDEEAAMTLASRVVHDVRAGRTRRNGNGEPEAARAASRPR